MIMEVLEEMERQDAKWGVQSHPDGTYPGALGELAEAGCTAKEARETYELMVKRGSLTWAEILWEEVAEAFEETDPEKLATELVQVAAVACQWAAAIKRRSK